MAKRSHAKKVVDQKFLLDLANEIHNPKKNTFLRLCTGTLQNGPDPKDKGRTMHCGLGELYFKLTGRQPETDGVNEDDVVEECLSRTSLITDETLEELQDKAADTIRKSLKSLNLPEDVLGTMVENAVDAMRDSDLSCTADEFRDTLNGIPDVNDNTGCSTDDDEGPAACSEDDYQERSQRVAEILRDAANLLPA